ncbi:MAG TPA: glycosyltransferase [Tepidisphaeraceae bacterium]|nr:glycosyltransferase [Tepidisphaeraceae bacterium]
MDLSIVIPAYNEAHKIARDIRASHEFLVSNGLSGEIIVADDGSPDGTAATAREFAASERMEVKVLALDHRGKGWAVREGMKASCGDFAMFADSGLCIPFADALPMIDGIRAGRCEIAHGSRKMKGSVIDRSQSLYRRVLSWGFRRAVLVYMNLPGHLTDTQCGFKAYRGDVARELYGQCRTDGFMFDLEILMRARKKGYRVAEFPVHWACDPDSRLRPAKILGSTISELRRVKQLMSE